MPAASLAFALQRSNLDGSELRSRHPYEHDSCKRSDLTLRFKARWLRGWPEALLRLNENWMKRRERWQYPRIWAPRASGIAAP